MVLEIQLPTMEEIKVAKKMAHNCPELLDDREYWIIENYCGGDEDD